VLKIRGQGHVLVGEPREPGVARVNAMQNARRTFACPFCRVVKRSTMAFRVHLGLHHESDFRVVRQGDGCFSHQVIRLFGRELRQWVDRCRRKNRHFRPCRRAPRGRAEFSRETATRNNSPLPVESVARQIVRINVIKFESSISQVTSKLVLLTSVGLSCVAMISTRYSIDFQILGCFFSFSLYLFFLFFSYLCIIFSFSTTFPTLDCNL